MTEQLKQFEVLKRASSFLQQNNCEPKIAEILLRHYLQMEQAQFYTNMQAPIQPTLLASFWKSIKKHVQTGIPIQHLIGYEYFYGRQFYVNEHVLIPRPETEEVVEKVISEINKHSNKDSLSVVDLGTGSGIIAITLALECPDVTIYATDISEKALNMARKNALKHQVDIDFMLGDFAKPLIEKEVQVQFIVSNPPYIDYSAKPKLSRTVSNYDPEIALFAKDYGLAAYQQIIDQSKLILAPNGVIIFEIGYDQGQSVSQIINQSYSTSDVEVYKDINGEDRMIVAKIN